MDCPRLRQAMRHPHYAKTSPIFLFDSVFAKDSDNQCLKLRYELGRGLYAEKTAVLYKLAVRPPADVVHFPRWRKSLVVGC